MYMSELIIHNQKIVDFYANNPHIDFENVNLLVIDLLDSLLNHNSQNMVSSVNSQILSRVNEICTHFTQINKFVDDFDDRLTKSLTLKLQEIKKDYMDDFRQIICNDSSMQYDKVCGLVQSNNNQLIDKTNLLLNDVVPRNGENQTNILREQLQNLHGIIHQETQKILNSTDKTDELQSFLNNFEIKYNQMMQPFYTVMNSSEERIHKEITQLRNGLIPDKLMHELSDFFGKYKNSSYKGQLGEQQLETTLNQIFPADEVINTSSLKASCDFRINRLNKVTILVETKEYDRNVSLDEVKKFIRDIELQQCHGIFLSQHSGITSKQNFQLDLIGKQIVIYIHNVKYDPTIIKMAIDVIDNLSEKMILFETDNTSDHSVSSEIIQEMEAEYKVFITKKLAFIEFLKENHKKMMQQVEEFRFPCISKFISQKSGKTLNCENREIVCNICNKFTATSNKSLAAHQRGCKKRVQSRDSNIVVDI